MGSLGVKGFIVGGILQRNSRLVRRLAARRERAVSIVTVTAVSIIVDGRDGASGVMIY